MRRSVLYSTTTVIGIVQRIYYIFLFPGTTLHPVPGVKETQAEFYDESEDSQMETTRRNGKLPLYLFYSQQQNIYLPLDIKCYYNENVYFYFTPFHASIHSVSS